MYGMDFNLVLYGNGVWYGYVGVELIKDELYIYNELILNVVWLYMVGVFYMIKLD